MKKLIAMLLAMAVCLACAAAAEAMDVTGNWYLNIIEMAGVQADPASLGRETTITLNPDGTATLADAGKPADMGLWSVNGSTVTIARSSGDTMEAQIDGAQLRVYEEALDICMVFGREEEAFFGYVPAAVEKNPDPSDFEGGWRAALIDMAGMQMNMDVMGMKLEVKISGDSAEVTSNQTGVEETYTTGVLLLGDTLTVEAAGDQMPMGLQLQQDGKLVWMDENNGMIINMYFEKMD